MDNYVAINILEKYTDDSLSKPVIEAHKIAIEAVRKMIPKSYVMKRAKDRDFRDKDTGEIVKVYKYHCPVCDDFMSDSDWDGKPSADWMEYCSMCGQRIDWVHDVDIPEDDEEENADRVLPVKLGYIYGEVKE